MPGFLIGDGGAAAEVEAVAAAAPQTWDLLWPPRACPEENTR
uniref:Uncharacterized protein n=1 Tax=Arundo donax TaxID=35708 RepID=A0A0A9AM82_ARUDO